MFDVVMHFSLFLKAIFKRHHETFGRLWLSLFGALLVKCALQCNFMTNQTYFKKSSELVNRVTRLSVISEISYNQTKNGFSGNRVDLGFLCIDF